MENQDAFFQFDFEKSSPDVHVDNVEPQSTSTALKSESNHYVPPATVTPSSQQAVVQTQQEFDEVIKSTKDVDIRLHSLLNQNQTVLQKWFPSKMQRLINEKDRLMVGDAMNFRRSLLQLGCEFRLEAMRDKYDGYLKAYKGQNRLQLAQFLMSKLTELAKSVRVEELNTLRELENMYFDANTLKIESLKTKYIIRIQAREDRFMDTIEKLLYRFESIVDENLSA